MMPTCPPDFTPNEGTADVYVHEYAIPTLADQMTTDETTTTTTSCTLFNDERNVNTAKTCYEGCEGWCQKDTDKTDKATNEKRCDLSGDKCNSTKPCPTKLCSETNVTCTDDNDCAENETCRDVNQLCFGNIAPQCTTWSRTENVRQYCDTTGEDSLLCSRSRRRTYYKPGVRIARQTPGKYKTTVTTNTSTNNSDWDDAGKCGLGFATAFDSNIQWCDNDELGMVDAKPDLPGLPLGKTYAHRSKTKVIGGSYFNNIDGIATVECLGNDVSQICEKTFPPTFMAEPFEVTNIVFPRSICANTIDEQRCRKMATNMNITIEDNPGDQYDACKISFTDNAISIHGPRNGSK